ncbi:hypothetical protein [Pseudomonas sp. NPDC086278]|uniref:hypothetical protein n=1 Tax=Pseudomonas sp. NPDC086278 TaxID=3390646 RepID=UPI003D00EFDF
MRSPDITLPIGPNAPYSESRGHHQADLNHSRKPAEGSDMEPRVVELETHLKYIRRDLEAVRGDVRSIMHRLAYAAGGTAVVLGLLGWVANSRFDQLVTLLAR